MNLKIQLILCSSPLTLSNIIMCMVLLVLLWKNNNTSSCVGCNSISNYYVIKFIRVTFHLKLRGFLWAFGHIPLILVQAEGVLGMLAEFDTVEITHNLLYCQLFFYVAVSPRQTKILHIPWSNGA